MPSTGACALCQKPGSTLQASHIVPEFFYKRIYTKSHKFTAVPLDDEESLAIEQKGYREDLMCVACETKLSKWEGKLSQFMNEIVTGSYTTFTANQVGPVTVVARVDYASIKMAVLSIFWRMGIAKHKLFATYDLGPYQEDFRMLLHQETVPLASEFPIFFSRCLLDGVFLPGIIFPVSRGRFAGNIIIQSVVLNGLVFDCLMTRSRTLPKEVLEFSLRLDGRVLIASRSNDDLAMDIGAFSKRMRRADVKTFYKKHAYLVSNRS